MIVTKKGIWPRLSREDGAVTVDWVVLTAAIVALGMIVGLVIWNNSGSLAQSVASYLSSQEVQTAF
ncbi:hypothetical protein CKO11_02020 [Rhodobacter sp. TJ_12]|uniref:hypothetical protein n=1 Tax=Rhodobacter sp. TJ_12 TaxID=2029399 RepID=UPI001CBEA922|nr:hypothetical protein [Rhodobacter sp. TJ_12]MBZ4021241.1 hypothetical protein [Rhodobacter sp. TJ_12]